MITAVCLNPSLDQTIRVARLLPGGTNRALSERTVPGGKGVNVALTLASLGQRARLAGFLCTRGSDLLVSAAADKGVECRWVPLEGTLRTNLKILDAEKREITEVNMSGAPVTKAEAARMLELTAALAGDSDWLVLTGSMPPGCESSFYADVIASVKKTAPKCRIALDAEGEALRLGVKAGPDFVKPNLAELSLYAGHALRGRQAVREAAEQLIASGVGAVMVSLGGDGSMYFEAGQALAAPAVPVPVVTTVGAGDAMVSAYLAARASQRPAAEAYRQAVAAAAARVAGEDKMVQKYLPLVKTEQI